MIPKVLVMDQGAVAEFDSPAALLAPGRERPSMFADLVAHWEEHSNN